MGLDGNKYWQQLQKPSLERLVPVQPGCRALDLATGNGLVARWLAGKGACVTASDGSEEMIKHAARRSSPDEAERISYRVLDVTLPEAFEDLAKSESAVRKPQRSNSIYWQVYLLTMCLFERRVDSTL